MAGETRVTLRELLDPGVHTVFVGINPFLTSVKAGHCYRRRLGRQLWRCLQEVGIGLLATSDKGQEDLTMLRQGFGFTDPICRPTVLAKELRTREWKQESISLIQRFQQLQYQPRIVFVYRSVAARIAPVYLRICPAAIQAKTFSGTGTLVGRQCPALAS